MKVSFNLTKEMIDEYSKLKENLIDNLLCLLELSNYNDLETIQERRKIEKYLNDFFSKLADYNLERYKNKK